jgi:hypothetical protein
MRYKTQLFGKAKLLEPNSEARKSIASSLKDKYGFDLKPQMDLLYLESCLVSAGSNVGVNDNDDIFTREEAWAARQTPVLKPFNWQHQDKDIVGVIYTVQARDTSGNILDINSETVPDVDFDLWTEAVIFRLVHPDRAREVEARSKAGDLYVSMEAWFDDYGYGLCNNGSLSKIVARNENTAFLDKHLRANSGVGKYRDPESGQEMRIGRVLRSITFGGCGLVDHPANKRSVITSVEVMSSDKQDEIELFLQQVLESEGSPSQELAVMNTQANLKPEEIKTAIESVLDAREQVAAKAAHEIALQARAATAEATSKELEVKTAELNKALEAKDAQVKSLNDQTAAYNDAVKKLIDEHVAAAGATDDTPPEIAKIDAAQTGEEAFKAKIAWIQNSLAGLRARAARATELEAKLAEAEAVVRQQDVRSLLGDIMSEEAVETFVAHAATLDNEAYSHWRDEKELMVIEIAKAAKKGKEGSPEEEASESDEEAMAEGDKMKKGKKKDAKADNPFAALLAKHRAESEANPDTMLVTNGDPLINHPGGPGINSGVNPGQLKTPRYKIAGGAAGNDPANALENAKPERSVSLAGAAQAGDEGEGVNPFRVLAGLVASSPKQESDVTETQPKAKKPGFDPVQ